MILLIPLTIFTNDLEHIKLLYVLWQGRENKAIFPHVRKFSVLRIRRSEQCDLSSLPKILKLLHSYVILMFPVLSIENDTLILYSKFSKYYRT